MAVEAEPTAEQRVLTALHQVIDPEMGIDVVDLGLIYGVTVDQDSIAHLDMTLTSAACPLSAVIEGQVYDALRDVVSDYRINWVWLPPWSPALASPDGREQLASLGLRQ